MADMGFLPEVRRLLDRTNTKRQTLLFSATLDGDVDVLIKNYQTNAAHHEAVSLEKQGEVTHRFWSVPHADRIQVATSIVERAWPRSEERRVGKEGVSTCRSRWAPYH